MTMIVAILAFGALVGFVLAGMNKCPVWVPGVLLSIAVLLPVVSTLR